MKAEWAQPAANHAFAAPDSFPLLEAAIDRAPEVRISGRNGSPYRFRRYSFGELGTRLDPALVDEILAGLADAVMHGFGNFDSIVAPEPGGHTWGLLLAYLLEKSVTILRSRSLLSNPGLHFERDTAYYAGELSCDRAPTGERVVVVDDIVSSGGTLASIVRCLRDQGVEVVGAQVILAKGDGWQGVERASGVPIQFLVQARSGPPVATEEGD
jgi:adenine phosphoribosyltransferase